MNVWNSGSMSYCDLKSIVFFFFKQKTAYEMRISDWSSDVCSSDLVCRQQVDTHNLRFRAQLLDYLSPAARRNAEIDDMPRLPDQPVFLIQFDGLVGRAAAIAFRFRLLRSEEHTSELQSLMRNSYAVFCLKKNTINLIVNCKATIT